MPYGIATIAIITILIAGQMYFRAVSLEKSWRRLPWIGATGRKM
jgi:hypothetical protein